MKVVTNNLTFKSSDEKIAVVNSIGQITGIVPGTVNITATYIEGNVTKTVAILVTVNVR